MTKGKKHKARVRARMEKTGEAYVTARAQLAPKISVIDATGASSVWVDVPELDQKLLLQFRAMIEPPTELAAPITQACARLASQLPGATIACLSLGGVVLAAINTDESMLERIREFGNPARNPVLMRAIDYVGMFTNGQFIAMRRLRPRKVGARLAMSALYVVFADEKGLDMARMRIDHAALAIEAILDDLRP